MTDRHTDASAPPSGGVFAYPVTDAKCGRCGVDGHVVETVTDQLVWHHEDAALEDDHDFEAVSGVPQVVYDPEWENHTFEFVDGTGVDYDDIAGMLDKMGFEDLELLEALVRNQLSERQGGVYAPRF